MSENIETAILAGGCFWPAQELLRHREGVISTRVGYTGGENDNPTADSHPGHAEAVEVIFDPERTSYRDILKFFCQIHRPDLGEGLVGSDYRSEIFYTSDEQRQVAEDTIADADASGRSLPVRHLCEPVARSGPRDRSRAGGPGPRGCEGGGLAGAGEPVATVALIWVRMSPPTSFCGYRHERHAARTRFADR
jgi:methionine-S-sulfoxide reductase